MNYSINVIKLYMPYILDENDAPLVDENGNKIEFNISYSETNDLYIHREGIYINNDGHLDTEDRYINIKEGVADNHAICKKQLDQLKQEIDNELLTLRNLLTASINNLKSEINLVKNRNLKTNNILPSNFNNN